MYALGFVGMMGEHHQNPSYIALSCYRAGTVIGESSDSLTVLGVTVNLQLPAGNIWTNTLSHYPQHLPL